MRSVTIAVETPVVEAEQIPKGQRWRPGFTPGDGRGEILKKVRWADCREGDRRWG